MMNVVRAACANLAAKARPFGGALKILGGVAALSAFAAMPSVSSAQTVLRDGTVVIGDDRGGFVRERILQIRALRQQGNEVRIEGRICLSTCTMFLGMPEACVSPNTTFGFHAPTINGRPMTGVDFENTTRIISNFYPAPIKAWYMSEGRNQTQGLARIRGSEMIRLGVRQC